MSDARKSLIFKHLLRAKEPLPVAQHFDINGDQIRDPISSNSIEAINKVL